MHFQDINPKWIQVTLRKNQKCLFLVENKRIQKSSHILHQKTPLTDLCIKLSNVDLSGGGGRIFNVPPAYPHVQIMVSCIATACSGTIDG